jgi:polyhydroxybutyrate depolymerase
MGKSVGVAIVVLLAIAGCRDEGRRDPVSSGTTSHTITVAGVDRSYRLYVPQLSSDDRVPLVVMLHGGFGTGKQAQEAYGWDAAADRHGFVVAYPDGLNRAWSVGGGCCGQPGRTGVDDVAVIEAVVTDVQTAVAVDPARIYATGMSNGAMMSYRLACDSALFAAVAPVAGTLMGDCERRRPIAILHIHGLADERVPFDGSPGSGYAEIDGPPVDGVIEAWRRADGCGPATIQTEGDVTTSRAACAGGLAVDLITVAGAGHQWPGSAPKSALEEGLGLDRPSVALDATETIWSFLAAHSAS